MSRFARLLKAADAMRGMIRSTYGVAANDPNGERPFHSAWEECGEATEFLAALKAFDDVPREPVE